MIDTVPVVGTEGKDDASLQKCHFDLTSPSCPEIAGSVCGHIPARLSPALTADGPVSLSFLICRERMTGSVTTGSTLRTKLRAAGSRSKMGAGTF